MIRKTASAVVFLFLLLVAAMIAAILLFFFLRADLYADLDDLALICLRDRDMQVAEIKLFAYLRNVIQFMDDPAGDGDEVIFIFFRLLAESVEHIIDISVALDEIRLIIDLLIIFLDRIMLVPDFSDELFDDVFHRDDAGSSAVFIQHDC